MGKHENIHSVCVYGGASKTPQIDALKRGCHMVVATPGRLNDLLAMNKVDLSRTTFLVRHSTVSNNLLRA